MTKLSKPAVKAYQRELRRQGFAARYRERSKHNGNMWIYGKWYNTPNRLGTAMEYRDVEVQLSDFGCRVSHMLYNDVEKRRGQGTTTPTGFTTIGEMVLAIALEVSRYDQWRYGIEHHDKNPRSYRPLMWMIDDNKIVRVTTSTLVGPPLMIVAKPSQAITNDPFSETYDGKPVTSYDTFCSTFDVNRPPMIDPRSGKTFATWTADRQQMSDEEFRNSLPPGPPTTANSKQSERHAYCDNCKRRRPMSALASDGPVYVCIDVGECYQSQRRQGFIHGT